MASRGLDIKNLFYVINYDFPTKLKTYVQRIGRTGRLAAYGHAFSFFTRNLVILILIFKKVKLLKRHRWHQI